MATIARTTYRSSTVYLVSINPLELSARRGEARKFVDKAEAVALTDGLGYKFEFVRVRNRKRRQKLTAL